MKRKVLTMVCLAAMTMAVFVPGLAKAELGLPEPNGTVVTTTPAMAEQARKQKQKGTTGAASGLVSGNGAKLNTLTFKSTNTVKGSLSAQGKSKVNIGGVDTGNGENSASGGTGSVDANVVTDNGAASNNANTTNNGNDSKKNFLNTANNPFGNVLPPKKDWNTVVKSDMSGSIGDALVQQLVQQYQDIILNKIDPSDVQRENLVNALAENPEAVRTINQSGIDAQDNAYASLGLIAADDSRYAQRVNNILGELSALTGVQLSGKVYMDDQVNAFSAGVGDGNIGNIRVYSGLLAAMPDDDQLFFVLAHEVGHIVASDNFAISVMNTLYNPPYQSNNLIIGPIINPFISLYDYIYENSKQQADIREYSLTSESAADEYAVTLMLNNGMSPMAAINAMKTLADAKPGSPPPNLPPNILTNIPTPWNEYGGQHPNYQDRIKNLETVIVNLSR